MKPTKKAFTMIELIFVIIVLGILASVALSSLSATRSDAMSVTLLDDLRTCISELANGYTATGEEIINTPSCQHVLKCFVINRGVLLTDGEFIISTHNNSQVDEEQNYCQEAQNKADNSNISKPLSSGGRFYSFGGNNLFY
jgi:prepilin-type N-terminal cleavage/methylation domain-containing protein